MKKELKGIKYDNVILNKNKKFNFRKFFLK